MGEVLFLLLAVMRIAIVVAFFVCFCYAQDHYSYDNPPLVAGSFIQTIYTGTLSSDQFVPTPLSDEGWGTSFCELKQDTNILFCHVCHNVKEPVRATISVGDRLQVGPVAYE